MKESFVITEVSREDLEEIGFDTSKVSDETMERLARKLGDDYCEQLFWTSLEVMAEYLEIPKKDLMERVKIHASIVDDITEQQVKQLANSEAYKNTIIRVMPDCHAGKGCTIGSVIQYTDKVVPNTVGVDIGCGMLVMELGQVDINLAELDDIIHKYIPSGFNIHDTPITSYKKKLIAHISDWEYIERSIGTLGGGNHFIELDEDDEGNKYLVIHSGSRNLGVQVCKYWQDKAVARLTDDSDIRKKLIDRLKAEGRAKDISEELKKIKKPKIDNDLAYVEGEDLEGYLHDMELCQKYAILNRNIMGTLILEALGIKEYKCFTTIHNYIDIPSKTIRKGAISAKNNERVLIPMNMRDGSLICMGKGNPDWLFSAPHGAGRIMSRMQAKTNLNIEDFQKSMKGIYTTSVCEETIDEAPMVYKDAKKIMEDIVPTVEILKVIKPLYNFKAKQ